MKPYFLETKNLSDQGFVAPKVLQLKAMLKERGIDTGESVSLDEIALMAKAGVE